MKIISKDFKPSMKEGLISSKDFKGSTVARKAKKKGGRSKNNVNTAGLDTNCKVDKRTTKDLNSSLNKYSLQFGFRKCR